MKKIIIISIIIFLLFPNNVFASSKINVKLSKCIDGDTAKFILNKEEIKVRFLAIDTPETKNSSKGEEPYGLEASEYTCKKLTNAKKIELEYEKNSEKTDKYGRHLAWIFYDDKLLQNELVKNGLAKVTYLYGDYKYTDLLLSSEKKAKNNKKGIYSNVDNSKYSKEKSFIDRINLKIEKYIKKIKTSVNDLFNDILNEIL